MVRISTAAEDRRLAAAFSSIEAFNIDRIEFLRLAYDAWRKREAGSELDSDEWWLAQEFEQTWRRALAAEKPRGFLARLDRALKSSYSEKLSLQEAARLAWRKLLESSPAPAWEQIKAEVKKSYGIERDADTWKKLRASEPFRSDF